MFFALNHQTRQNGCDMTSKYKAQHNHFHEVVIQILGDNKIWQIEIEMKIKINSRNIEMLLVYNKAHQNGCDMMEL